MTPTQPKGEEMKTDCASRPLATSAEPAKSEIASGIYVASRASVPERGKMWRAMRASGVPIISTWIDEDGPGESPDMRNLWTRIISEVGHADALVLYVEAGDFPLKGALVEIGAALACGIPVHVAAPGVELEPRSMRPLGSWASHPLVTMHSGVLSAVHAALLDAELTPATNTGPSTAQAEAGATSGAAQPDSA